MLNSISQNRLFKELTFPQNPNGKKLNYHFRWSKPLLNEMCHEASCKSIWQIAVSVSFVPFGLLRPLSPSSLCLGFMRCFSSLPQMSRRRASCATSKCFPLFLSVRFRWVQRVMSVTLCWNLQNGLKHISTTQHAETKQNFDKMCIFCRAYLWLCSTALQIKRSVLTSFSCFIVRRSRIFSDTKSVENTTVHEFIY